MTVNTKQPTFFKNRAKELEQVAKFAPERHIGKGLGRLPSADEKDRLHLMSAVLPRRVELKTRYWTPGIVLDQGSTSQCVAYSWTQFLQTSPTRTRLSLLGTDFMFRLYTEAKKNDEWPGEEYEGTSVRAGARILTEWNRLVEYVWAFDAETLKRFVLTRGPAVLGTDWYEEMFYPERHRDTLVAEGDIAGGHAWLVLGYSESRKAFRMINSWGKTWGQNGRAWVPFATMEQLVAQQGEACSAIEKVV